MYVENGKTAFTQGSVFQSPKPGGRVSAFHLFVKQMLPIAVEIELIQTDACFSSQFLIQKSNKFMIYC
jgi:hypothetical protein